MRQEHSQIFTSTEVLSRKLIVQGGQLALESEGQGVARIWLRPVNSLSLRITLKAIVNKAHLIHHLLQLV